MENSRRNYLPVLYSPFPHSQLLEKNGYIAVSPHGKLTIVGFPPFNSQINPTKNYFILDFLPVLHSCNVNGGPWQEFYDIYYS